MFGANEEIARVLVKERLRAADCKGEYREWCRLEYRLGTRHG